MPKMIRVCESRYGAKTCIYKWVNVDSIIQAEIVETEYEINLELTIKNNDRVLVLYEEDIITIFGEEKGPKVLQEIKERFEEKEKEYGRNC